MNDGISGSVDVVNHSYGIHRNESVYSEYWDYTDIHTDSDGTILGSTESIYSEWLHIFAPR